MSWSKNDRGQSSVSPKENVHGHGGFGTKTEHPVSVSTDDGHDLDTDGHGQQKSD